MPEAAALPGIEVVGIDVHIGSQLTELAPYEAAFLQGGGADGRCSGRTGTRSGGSISAAGSGIPYERSNQLPPLPFDYGEVVRRTVGHLGCEIEIEPGRLIAGNAGLLLARVI